MLASRICNRADFDAHWFQQWRPFFKKQTANGICLGQSFFHRKEWEFVVTTQALFERGMLCPGKRGIGFGVGREPLAGLFASYGCHILATDHWTDQDGLWTNYWATSKAALAQPELCSAADFEARVCFQRVDMRNIPSDLTNFDFSWSCCALEHLGGLEAGRDFLLAQSRCLKPGGIGIHSLEFNLSSNDDTITHGPTVIYRKRDIEDIAAAVRANGFDISDVDFNVGSRVEDAFVAIRPYQDQDKNVAHLRIRIGTFIATSLALIITKKGTPCGIDGGTVSGQSATSRAARVATPGGRAASRRGEIAGSASGGSAGSK